MKSQNKYFEVIDFLKENSKGVIFLVVMGSIIYLLYQFRYNSRMHLSDKYHCVSIGHILSISTNENISQRLDGSFVIVDSYSVSYNYQVNGRVFEKKNLIDNIAKNRTLIEMIYKEINKEFKVLYDCNYPDKSIITYEEEKVEMQ